MAYQIKYKKRGFTLVELIIVVAIFSVFLTISVSTYTNMKSNSSLLISTYDAVDTLRYAQINAQKSKEDSDWGVKFFENEIVLFKGDAYDSRDTNFDQVTKLTKQVQIINPTEIVFDKLTGWTNDTGTTTIVGSDGTKDIYINEKGTITY